MGLLNEMNQYCVQQPKRAKGAGRQLFIAQKAEIQEVINAGYPMTEIWQYLHENGRMPIVYRVFVEYVHRFITNPQQAEKEKRVATKNNGVEGNSTLAARLEKPSSVNTNVHEGAIAKQERLPRGLGGSSSIAKIPLKEAEDPKNHPNSPIFDNLSPKFRNNSKPEAESLI